MAEDVAGQGEEQVGLAVHHHAGRPQLHSEVDVQSAVERLSPTSSLTVLLN